MQKWRSWGLCLLLLLSMLHVGEVHAQKSFYWQRLDVEITVNEDGTFWVEETHVLNFSGGTFTFGYRNIDLRRIGDITNVSVEAEGRSYERSQSEAPYTFRTTIEDGDLYIYWYFPPTEGRATYTLRYLVRDTVRYYEEGDQLWWKAVPSDLDARVQESRVTVNLPVEAERAEAYGIDAEVRGAATAMVTFEALEPVNPGEEFEVRVQFPSGVVAGEAAPWQQREDFQDQYGDAITLLTLFGSLFLLVLGAAGLIFLWYVKGRDPQLEIPADILPQPPSADPPGVVGALVDEKVDMEDIVATLVDLARRGYLIFEEEQKKGIFNTTNREFTFRRTEKSRTDLEPYEGQLIDAVLGGRESRRLDDLREKFYKKVPGIKKRLYETLVERGYFPASPNSVRGRYSALGGLILVVGILLSVALSCLLSSWVEGAAFCPGGAIGLLGVLMLVLAQFMPHKTREGKELALKWKAFKRYLEDLERYTDLQQATELFEKYLPYAIAFGMERSWVNKFTRLPTDTFVPLPTWYRPYYAPGRSTGRGSMAPGGSGRSGGGLPSLNEASEGLSGGLQSMSDGLISMLNTTSSTFSSTPSSSGSGGGGWSGGGGGGGGGSGGGGGGFG
ncbi:MAG: DUF2207 family protein [Anaerolineales bacterium]